MFDKLENFYNLTFDKLENFYNLTFDKLENFLHYLQNTLILFSSVLDICWDKMEMNFKSKSSIFS